MEKKEPYATKEEFKKRIVHYADVPPLELFPDMKSHIVSTEKITLSFLTLEPNSFVAVHRHESEQTAIVTDGALDLIIEGKLYHVEKGDVATIPPNTDHGVYVSDRGCQGIDVFSPPRQDYVAKLAAVKKSLGK